MTLDILRRPHAHACTCLCIPPRVSAHTHAKVCIYTHMTKMEKEKAYLRWQHGAHDNASDLGHGYCFVKNNVCKKCTPSQAWLLHSCNPNNLGCGGYILKIKNSGLAPATQGARGLSGPTETWSQKNSLLFLTCGVKGHPSLSPVLSSASTVAASEQREMAGCAGHPGWRPGMESLTLHTFAGRRASL